jgi:hypothetical protein
LATDFRNRRRHCPVVYYFSDKKKIIRKKYKSGFTQAKSDFLQLMDAVSIHPVIFCMGKYNPQKSAADHSNAGH